MTPKTDDTFACSEASEGYTKFASASSCRNTAGPAAPVMGEENEQPVGIQDAFAPESDNAYWNLGTVEEVRYFASKATYGSRDSAFSGLLSSWSHYPCNSNWCRPRQLSFEIFY